MQRVDLGEETGNTAAVRVCLQMLESSSKLETKKSDQQVTCSNRMYAWIPVAIQEYNLNYANIKLLLTNDYF